MEIILDYFNIIKVQWNLAGDYHGSSPDFMKELKFKKEPLEKQFEKEEMEATEVPASLTVEKSKTLLKEKEVAVNQAVMEYQR